MCAVSIHVYAAEVMKNQMKNALVAERYPVYVERPKSRLLEYLRSRTEIP